MTSFNEEEKALAEKIIIHLRRTTAKNYSYLENAIFCLEAEASEAIRYIGINYKKLYYNPIGVIELYSTHPHKLETMLLHEILHCLLLHPSVGTAENELFDRAADVTVNAMLENIPHNYIHRNRDLMKEYDCQSAIELYNKALTDNRLRKKMSALTSNKLDDHCVWRFEEEEKSTNPGGKSANNTGEAAWRQMFSSAAAGSGRLYGNGTGNLFAPIKPPDRFSRFSYKEYIRRFAVEELFEEDPEAIDMLLYTTSTEMYGNTPIVEWNHVRECSNPSDIIIAIDMSGSCGGDVASNFLRQVYTLFEEMNIKGNVNIHAVFFDTKILETIIIKNKNDADRFIAKYTPHGFGGTDFNCVFDYADEFRKKSRGKKLKGLFFFSDACGSFPQKKKNYPTTFFVPNNWGWSTITECAPPWIELVHYDD